MNISEFERSKPTLTHSSIMKAKEKYEKILEDTVIMDAEDSVRVEMASLILKDLKEIYLNFVSGK